MEYQISVHDANGLAVTDTIEASDIAPLVLAGTNITDDVDAECGIYLATLDPTAEQILEVQGYLEVANTHGSILIELL